MKPTLLRIITAGLAVILLLTPTTVFASSPFISSFNTVTELASTVPAIGDINPYGVAVVPRTTGALVKGEVLVSNFNNSGNAQGTGTTIVQVSPGGKVSLFSTISTANLPGACPGGIGLTTALAVLKSGWVIVGILPTTDGSSSTAQAGCLIVLNSWGHPVETISGKMVNGPWDMAAVDLSDDRAALFVSNVLNGTVANSPNTVNMGTVVRFVLSTDGKKPKVKSSTVIGSGFPEKTDPAALVIGPTGLGLGKDGVLYVADTLANRVAAIPNALHRTSSAGTGHTISTGGSLNGPLGLAIAPHGDILVTNGGDGNLVEITPGGSQVAVKGIDDTGAGGGTLFGLAITPKGNGIYFVNDGNNMLDLFH